MLLKLPALLLLEPVAVLALHAALLDVIAQGKTAPRRKADNTGTTSRRKSVLCTAGGPLQDGSLHIDMPPR